MPTKSKTTRARETVPSDRGAYDLQVDSRFGRTFDTPADRQNTRLFDPALPEDQMMQRSLAPWVAKTAMWNLIQRGRGRDTTTRPLNKLEEVQRKAVMSNRAAKAKTVKKYGQEAADNSVRDTEAIRKIWGQRLMGRHGEAYRQGLADPNRPVRDWDAEKVSPKFYNPKTGKYDLLPGLK